MLVNRQTMNYRPSAPEEEQREYARRLAEFVDNFPNQPMFVGELGGRKVVVCLASLADRITEALSVSDRKQAVSRFKRAVRELAHAIAPKFRKGLNINKFDKEAASENQ